MEQPKRFRFGCSIFCNGLLVIYDRQLIISLYPSKRLRTGGTARGNKPEIPGRTWQNPHIVGQVEGDKSKCLQAFLSQDIIKYG